MISADRNTMFQIAVISKSYGTNGECLFSFLNAEPEDIKVTEPVFIYFDGLPVPFFIDNFERKGNKRCLVKLTDIDSFESAEEIVGKEVYILTSDEDGEYDENFIDSLFDETGFFNENGLRFLVGWTVYNLIPSSEAEFESKVEADADANADAESEELQEVGTIADYENISGNPCLYVDLSNDEQTRIMVPLHEDLIVSINIESKELILNLPEGLI